MKIPIFCYTAKCIHCKKTSVSYFPPHLAKKIGIKSIKIKNNTFINCCCECKAKISTIIALNIKILDFVESLDLLYIDQDVFCIECNSLLTENDFDENNILSQFMELYISGRRCKKCKLKELPNNISIKPIKTESKNIISIEEVVDNQLRLF